LALHFRQTQFAPFDHADKFFDGCFRFGHRTSKFVPVNATFAAFCQGSAQVRNAAKMSRRSGPK
jgi:hypothetical protein